MQFDNAQNRSTTPGEIDPANISISGGLFYQNNFQIDGFNMNNDLTSNLSSDNGVNGTGTKNPRSQAFSIDTSLLESITVQDSNISASYGGFTGGVVEANVRKPRKDNSGINGWHANISYQFTQGNAKGFSLTRYHIDPQTESNFLNSTSEYYHPYFTKHLVRASLEGYATKNLGLISSFTTTQSFIPIFMSNPLASASGINAGKQKDQKRQSYNYYLKAYYNPNENLTIEANLGYMPQYNSYFWSGGAYNADYVAQSGGWQAGVKALYQTPIGLSTTTLGYSYLDNNRSADSRYTYYASWFVSDEVNWLRSNTNTAAIYTAANYGNMTQISHNPTLKSDFLFNPIPAWRTEHTFRIGAELTYQSATRERLSPYVQFANDNNIPVPSSTPCPTTPDNLGLIACINGKPHFNPNTAIRSNNQTYQGYAEASKNEQVRNQHTGANSWANGYDSAVAQYFNVITQYYGANKIMLDNVAYGAFIEDDIKLDLGLGGEISTRFGLRFDGDSYMSKHSFAPRFSLSYITPAQKEWQTQLTFGANRYYGRNLFSYRFLDFSAKRHSYKRDCASCDWQEIELNTTINPAWTSSVKFSQLKIPYSDELMGGINQNLGIFSASVKYIFRDGKDEIMRVSRSALNLPTQEGYSTSYNVWSNEGASQSHIVLLMMQNNNVFDTFGVKHHYVFAFDYTQSKRTYNVFANSSDDEYIADSQIIYDNALIRYRDRPVDNFVRPWTLRFNTTHSFNIGRTKWLLNNFFRYRSAYSRMVTLTTSTNNAIFKQWQALYPNIEGVYIKKHFNGAFSWDMRAGFELDIVRGQTLYMNVDIYNVLNARNETTISNSSGNTGYDIAGSSYTYAVYEVGRQFWLQVGYKF
ncbi:TonB-dependent receptor [Helicobacter sp. 23-1048]